MSALLFKLERSQLEQLEACMDGRISTDHQQALRLELLRTPTGEGMQGVGQMKDLVAHHIARLKRRKAK